MMKKISFFLLIFISIFVLSGCNKDNSVIDKTNEQREKVIGLCEDEVLNQLKSPGSAVFGEKRTTLTVIYPDIYTLKNYVDSQNSYGALLRLKFVCSFRDGKVQLITFDSDDPNLHRLYEIVAKE